MKVQGILAAAVCLLCLAGCAGRGQAAASSSGESPAAESTAPSDGADSQQASSGFAPAEPMAEPFTVSTPIQDVIDAPVFAGYGRLLFPVNEGYMRGDTLGELQLTWYNNIDPNETVEIVNIDLYFQHRIDPHVEPETVAEVMADLIREGKITHWGISEANEDYLRRAHAVCPVTAVQNRYSMMARQYEPLFPVLEELGVGLVAFSPMANGFLTGRYGKGQRFDAATDYRASMPQFTDEAVDQNAALLQLLLEMAAEKNATPAQISMAWMLCKRPWIVPIPGTCRIVRERTNGCAGEPDRGVRGGKHSGRVFLLVRQYRRNGLLYRRAGGRRPL